MTIARLDTVVAGGPAHEGTPPSGLSLAVVRGPLAGRCFAMVPGETLRVGRSARAAISIPDDIQLGSLHLALEYRDRVFRVVDLGSANGTFLNGIRIQEARLREGDRVEAGQSVFEVHFAAPVPERPSVPPPAVPEIRPVRATAPAPCDDSGPLPDLSPIERRVMDLLVSGQEHLFAVIDLEANPAARRCLDRAGARCGELWKESGTQQSPSSPGPALVELVHAPQLLETLVRHGWGRNWIVWLACEMPFEAVFAHVRSVSLLETGRGTHIPLRIGDPRLMRAFLPHLTTWECAGFFGPITRFLVESEDGEAVIDFRRSTDGIARDLLSLR